MNVFHNYFRIHAPPESAENHAELYRSRPAHFTPLHRLKARRRAPEIRRPQRIHRHSVMLIMST